jgi:hypothetical protein
MSKNNARSINYEVNTDEYSMDFNDDDYDVNFLNIKLSKQKTKKNNNFNDEIQVQNNSRILLARRRSWDTRYSLKNRRTVNKDWKDFNNNQ